MEAITEFGELRLNPRLLEEVCALKTMGKGREIYIPQFVLASFCKPAHNRSAAQLRRFYVIVTE